MNAGAFGRRLRELRTAQGHSLRKLAELLGVHYVYISQVERGLEKPSESFVRKVAEFYRLTNLDELLLLAGKIPTDLKRILVENPEEAPILLREQVGLDFLDKRRQKILRIWKHYAANAFSEIEVYPVLDEINGFKYKGYDVRAAEALVPEAHALYAEGKTEKLLRQIARIRQALREARRPVRPAEEDTPADWPGLMRIVPALQGPSSNASAPSRHIYLDKTHGAWLGKCIGCAFGLPIEGWNAAQIETAFGELRFYLTPPNTVNDDTSFEIVFLHALETYGPALTSTELALEWLEHIPVAYTAEKIALDNLRHGHMPPASGAVDNPFSEWIGAQMRGEVCGLIAPGRPDLAADYAFRDAIISHEREGVYAEIYCAALISLAFSIDEPLRLIETALAYIPPRCRLRRVVEETLHRCETSRDWQEAWRRSEESELGDYHWIHAFPNLAAVIIALWFGRGDFDRSLRIAAMCGRDTDCNAGQVGALLGTILGAAAIPAKWSEPLADRLDSEIIGFEHLRISETAAWTVKLGGDVLRPK